MGKKIVAGLVAAVVVVPACAACVLGPAVLASILAGITGWLVESDPVVLGALVLVAAVTVFALVRRPRQRVPLALKKEVSDER